MPPMNILDIKTGLINNYFSWIFYTVILFDKLNLTEYLL